MTRWLWRSRVVRLALAACVAAVAILGGAVWQALRPLEVQAPAVFAMPAETTRDAVGPPGYPLERLLAALEKDPFHPERRRPGARFQLPAVAAARGRSRRPVAAPSVRVVGTAVAPDGGGFAMCELAGGTPRIVRLGERVGDWTLKRVTPGAAEFATPTGTMVVVRVPKAGGGGT